MSSIKRTVISSYCLVNLEKEIVEEYTHYSDVLNSHYYEVRVYSNPENWEHKTEITRDTYHNSYRVISSDKELVLL